MEFIKYFLLVLSDNKNKQSYLPPKELFSALTFAHDALTLNEFIRKKKKRLSSSKLGCHPQTSSAVPNMPVAPINLLLCACFRAKPSLL